MHWMSSLGNLLNSVPDMSNLTVEVTAVLLQIRSVVSMNVVHISACIDNTAWQEGSLYPSLSELQLMDSKSAELERLLSQLSDVNDSMRNALGGRNDTRAHTLTRHRDILHDYQQVQAVAALPATCAVHWVES